MDLGIYIHVPFCVKKCPYCDFYSMKYETETVTGYVSSLVRNLSAFGERNGRRNVGTVYFGGGTPSLLSPEKISFILEAIKRNFLLSDDAEITMEANPALSGRDRLSHYKNAGISRISFGVQSFDENELKRLGRSHSPERAIEAIENAYAAGIENISADLMLGIEGQTSETLKKSVDTVSRLPLSHISAYMLKIEDGTPFDCDRTRSAVPSDDEAAALYLEAVERLERIGLTQYEISNFAKEGRESRHNLIYWKCGDYAGFGPAAHSCFGGVRYAVPCDIRSFNGSDVQTEEITEKNPCGFEEFAMLRLRLTEGLSLSECERKFGANKDNILQKAIPLEKAKLLKIEDDDRIILTPNGFLVSNGIIERLVL